MIVYLHGLESGPHGSKFKALDASFPGQVVAPDCTGLDSAADRVTASLPYLTPGCILVGSSMGALVANLLAAARPDLVSGVVYLAPAFLRSMELMQPHPSIPSITLHGTHDNLFDHDQTRAACESLGIKFESVSGGEHRLETALAAMVDAVRRISP